MGLTIKIKRLKDTKIPDQPYDGDAGFDLYTSEEITLNPGEHKAISTGIAIAVPKGYVGLIWDKSGISIKKGLKTLGGVVDSGYRGEIFVGMVNISKEPHIFNKGDKVAQILVQKVEQINLEEVDELNETERGEKRLGSSGK